MLKLTPVFGIAYCLFILLTAWFGVSIMMVLYPLILVAPDAWRKWRDWLGGKWLAMPTVCSFVPINIVRFRLSFSQRQLGSFIGDRTAVQ